MYWAERSLHRFYILFTLFVWTIACKTPYWPMSKCTVGVMVYWFYTFSTSSFIQAMACIAPYWHFFSLHVQFKLYFPLELFTGMIHIIPILNRLCAQISFFDCLLAKIHSCWLSTPMSLWNIRNVSSVCPSLFSLFSTYKNNV